MSADQQVTEPPNGSLVGLSHNGSVRFAYERDDENADATQRWFQVGDDLDGPVSWAYLVRECGNLFELVRLTAEPLGGAR